MLSTIDLRGRDERLRPRPPGSDPRAEEAVREIVRRVREGGDEALFDLTERFDGPNLRGSGLLATDREISEGAAAVPADLSGAIDGMIERLRDLHRRQLPAEWWDERAGVRFGEIVRPLRRAGCYVPGGRAAYPSTVAMTVVPARTAGVEEVLVCSPPDDQGRLPPAVLYAASRAGADGIAKLGGAQAVAAMAYGTESIPAVDKIVGPGNLYVTLAKRQVAGDVGIDGLAGPTELVVVAGPEASPGLVALDLIAQAEHDPQAATTLVAFDESQVQAVGRALAAVVGRAARRDVVEASLRHLRAVIVDGLEGAARVVNDLAPEHLQVVLPDPEPFLPLVRNAGAVFLGSWTAVPFGDYGVGSNHVLPTMGTARFASGLRAADFVTVSSVVEVSPGGLAETGPSVAAVAMAEGLEGHARAVLARMSEAG